VKLEAHGVEETRRRLAVSMEVESAGKPLTFLGVGVDAADHAR